MKNKTLPSIRVDEKTYDNLVSAIKKFNEDSLVKMSGQDFRRLAYEFLSQIILQSKEKQVRNILQLQ